MYTFVVRAAPVNAYESTDSDYVEKLAKALQIAVREQFPDATVVAWGSDPE